MSKPMALFPAFSAAFSLAACGSLRKNFDLQVKEEFDRQPLKPEEILREEDIAHLPQPVQQYLRYTGAVGRGKIQNFRLQFSAEMFAKPDSKAMQASSEQLNFLKQPTRLFWMKARMKGLPVQVFHSYRQSEASMRVRLASLFNVVDLQGEVLNKTETVTLFNDLCIYAPSALAGPNVSWKEISNLSSQATFTKGPYTISALLFFNEKGEIINFVSEDRSAGPQDDGSFRQAKFSTPVRDYREFEGRKVPTYGEAIWNYPEGDFTYGKFTVTAIHYNVKI